MCRHLCLCYESNPNQPDWPILSTARIPVEATINVILAEMQPVLTPSQLKRLKAALERAFEPQSDEPNAALLKTFLTAKEVEGCSLKTLEYYESTLQKMTDSMTKPYTQIDSNDLRKYLNDYEASRGSSKVTIDNIRRIMSSFFLGSRMRTISLRALFEGSNA